MTVIRTRVSNWHAPVMTSADSFEDSHVLL